MKFILFYYGIPLAISALFFATGHYTIFFTYVIATALYEYLPKALMNKQGDARFLFLLNMIVQLLVAGCGIYSIYLVITLLFF